MSIRRKIYYAITLGIVAVLLLLPSTAWLARIQLLPFLYSPPDWTRVAKQAPDDFAIQLAYATRGQYADEQVRRLEAMQPRFGQDPVLLATQLRMMLGGQVHLSRYDDYEILVRQRVSSFDARTGKNDHAVLKRFLQLAEAGEAREPRNAYFSMMVALGYFAMHRDAEGMAAWTRGATKNEWDDHVSEKIAAEWKWQRAMRGGQEPGAMNRVDSLSGISFFHLAKIRDMARLLAAKAVQAEMEGETENAIRLRRSVCMAGQLLLLHGKSIASNNTGKHLVEISAVRPNPSGAAPKEGDERAAEHPFFLRKSGHPEEAEAFAQALAQEERLTKIDDMSVNQAFARCGERTFDVIRVWCMDAILLSGALFSLTFAALFKLVYRFSPRLQRGEALQASARWGIGLGLFLPILVGAISYGIASDWSDKEDLPIAGAVLCGLLFLLPPALLRLSWRAIGHGLLVMLATLVSLVTLAATGALVWQMVFAVVQQFVLLSFVLDLYHNPGREYLFPLVAGCLVSTVPLVLLVLFGVASRLLGVPFAAGVTRGLRATAVPLAAFFLLLWAGALVYTSREDQRATAELQRIVTDGEARTYATITGLPAP